jgi:hypothetical protein
MPECPATGNRNSRAAANPVRLPGRRLRGTARPRPCIISSPAAADSLAVSSFFRPYG